MGDRPVGATDAGTALRIRVCLALAAVALATPPAAGQTGTGTEALRWSFIVLLAGALVAAAWVARRITPVPPDIPMSFLAHVEELRRRMVWILFGWLAATAFVFSFRIEDRGGWPVPIPGVQENLAAQAFRRLRDDLVPADVELIVVRPMDGFMAELMLAAGIGFLLALPWTVFHFNRFFGPALKPRERRLLDNALVPVVLLFAAGAAFCYLFVLPFVLEALYGYTTALGAHPFLHVADFIGFTVVLLLTFGIAFQTPLVMYALARVGIGSSRFYLHYWRHAAVAVFVLAALVTDPTVISQLLVAIPVMVLYFMGIGLVKVAEGKTAGAT